LNRHPFSTPPTRELIILSGSLSNWQRCHARIFSSRCPVAATTFKVKINKAHFLKRDLTDRPA
jgi:hypothetical protein